MYNIVKRGSSKIYNFNEELNIFNIKRIEKRLCNIYFCMRFKLFLLLRFYVYIYNI